MLQCVAMCCNVLQCAATRHIHKTRDVASGFDASEACQYVKSDVCIPKETYKSAEEIHVNEKRPAK